MVEAGDSRLHARSAARMSRVLHGQRVIFVAVTVIVLGSIAANVVSAYFLITSQIGPYRAMSVIVAALSVLLDFCFLLLVWILFDEIHRSQREAERLQTFMDNVYRRL